MRSSDIHSRAISQEITQPINHQNLLENYLSKISLKSTRDQWVQVSLICYIMNLFCVYKDICICFYKLYYLYAYWSLYLMPTVAPRKVVVWLLHPSGPGLNFMGKRKKEIPCLLSVSTELGLFVSCNNLYSDAISYKWPNFTGLFGVEWIYYSYFSTPC